MRKLWIGMFVLVSLFGCTKSEQKEYKLTSEAIIEKIDNKETFVVVINQTNNQAGMVFQRTLEPFMREHSTLAIYEVMLDEQGEKKQDANLALNKIVDKIPSFEGMLPSMLYFKDGVVEKQLDGALSEIAWRNFLKACGILKGEVESEPSAQLAESKMFNTNIEQLYEDWKQGKELYISAYEQDIYNVKFSTTLKKYAEENKQSIYVLNVNEVRLYSDPKFRAMLDNFAINMTPTLLHIKEGKVSHRLEDNASAEEVENWF